MKVPQWAPRASATLSLDDSLAQIVKTLGRVAPEMDARAEATLKLAREVLNDPTTTTFKRVVAYHSLLLEALMLDGRAYPGAYDPFDHSLVMAALHVVSQVLHARAHRDGGTHA